MAYTVGTMFCTTTAVVEASHDKINLAQWLLGVTNAEYISFTPRSGAHKSMRVRSHTTGKPIIENVEFISGAIMTHQYLPEIMEADHTVVVCPTTHAKLLDVVPFTFTTVWELKITPLDAERSELACCIEVEYHSKLWWFLSLLIFSSFWLRRHDQEETPEFARNIASKIYPETSKSL